MLLQGHSRNVLWTSPAHLHTLWLDAVHFCRYQYIHLWRSKQASLVRRVPFVQHAQVGRHIYQLTRKDGLKNRLPTWRYEARNSLVAQSTIPMKFEPSTMMFLGCRSPCVNLMSTSCWSLTSRDNCFVQSNINIWRIETLSKAWQCVFRGHLLWKNGP